MEIREDIVSSNLNDLPINLDRWIEDNGHNLKPPIGNLAVLEATLAEPAGHDGRWAGYRPDYHDDPGEELFIQLRGDVTLKLIDPATRVRSEVIVREGEMYLLPSHVRHSPQRPEGCIGLVIERYRQPGEVDALEWYDDRGNLTFGENSSSPTSRPTSTRSNRHGSNGCRIRIERSRQSGA